MRRVPILDRQWRRDKRGRRRRRDQVKSRTILQAVYSSSVVALSAHW
jgi:hypothetical protein